MNTILTGHSIVGLSTLKTSSTFRAIDPKTDRELPPDFHPISPSSIDEIVAQTQDAFPIYSRLSGKKRAAFLREIAAEIEAVEEDLTERMPLETALPEARVRGECARTIAQLRLFADLVEEGSWVDARIETAQPDRHPIPKPDLRSLRQPLGPVLIFCASNFPLAFSVAGGDSAAALAAGCPIIVKAHHSHPGTAEIIGQAVMRAVQKCELPPGTFSLIYGSGKEIGTMLIKHPLIKAVGFTGSRSGGKALMKAAFDRDQPIPVYAEMSSINPVVIFPKALQANCHTIVKGLSASITLGLGQFCTNPGLIFIPECSDSERFAKHLKDELSSTKGYALNSKIAESYRTALREISNTQDKKVITHLLPESNSTSKCQMSSALIQIPIQTFLSHRAFHQEAFGPSTLLVTYGNKVELLSAIHALEGQLTGTIHGIDSELDDASEIISALKNRVGRLLFGGFPTGVEVCHSMVHGGPFPATSEGRSTSVGTLSIDRFVRSICYQNTPDALLPDELKDANPLGILRLINGNHTRNPLS